MTTTTTTTITAIMSPDAKHLIMHDICFDVCDVDELVCASRQMSIISELWVGVDQGNQLNATTRSTRLARLRIKVKATPMRATITTTTSSTNQRLPTGCLLCPLVAGVVVVLPPLITSPQDYQTGQNYTQGSFSKALNAQVEPFIQPNRWENPPRPFRKLIKVLFGCRFSP